MFPQALLVLSIFLSLVSAFPYYESLTHNGDDKSVKIPSNLPLYGYQREMNDTTKENTISATETTKEITETEQPNDLTGQETFYPTGGIWWGIRPWGGWGGWGGFRPWYGWHGWHGWRGPHWGGGRWGRTSS